MNKANKQDIKTLEQFDREYSKLLNRVDEVEVRWEDLAASSVRHIISIFIARNWTKEMTMRILDRAWDTAQSLLKDVDLDAKPKVH